MHTQQKITVSYALLIESNLHWNLYFFSEAPNVGRPASKKLHTDRGLHLALTLNSIRVVYFEWDKSLFIQFLVFHWQNSCVLLFLRNTHRNHASPKHISKMFVFFPWNKIICVHQNNKIKNMGKLFPVKGLCRDSRGNPRYIGFNLVYICSLKHH